MRKARHHNRHARASYQRLELITESKRRRARSAREKAAIVAEAFAPGANVTKIRRHYGVLFSWRRQVRRARPSAVADAPSEEAQDPVFVPVEIEGPVGSPAGPIISDPPSPTPLAPDSQMDRRTSCLARQIWYLDQQLTLIGKAQS